MHFVYKVIRRHYFIKSKSLYLLGVILKIHHVYSISTSSLKLYNSIILIQILFYILNTLRPCSIYYIIYFAHGECMAYTDTVSSLTNITPPPHNTHCVFTTIHYFYTNISVYCTLSTCSLYILHVYIVHVYIVNLYIV